MGFFTYCVEIREDLEHFLFGADALVLQCCQEQSECWNLALLAFCVAICSHVHTSLSDIQVYGFRGPQTFWPLGTPTNFQNA